MCVSVLFCGSSDSFLTVPVICGGKILCACLRMSSYDGSGWLFMIIPYVAGGRLVHLSYLLPLAEFRDAI